MGKLDSSTICNYIDNITPDKISADKDMWRAVQFPVIYFTLGTLVIVAIVSKLVSVGFQHPFGEIMNIFFSVWLGYFFYSAYVWWGNWNEAKKGIFSIKEISEDKNGSIVDKSKILYKDLGDFALSYIFNYPMLFIFIVIGTGFLQKAYTLENVEIYCLNFFLGWSSDTIWNKGKPLESLSRFWKG